MNEEIASANFGHETVPMKPRMVQPTLRLAYKAIARISKQEVRQKWYERLYLIRNWLHPKGRIQIARTSLNNSMPIYVNLCEKVGGDIYYGLGFESTELEFVRKTLVDGDVFFDVGANIGMYSLTASHLVGVSGRVHAFEPLDNAFDILQMNLQLNHSSNVSANCVAVSDIAGVAELQVNQESALTSIGKTNRGKVVQTKTVPLVTLDEYADETNIQQLDFLKIDVEGYEGHVLRGGEGLIRRSKDLIILCELSEKNYQPLNLSVNEVLEWIRARGYEIWEVFEDGRPIMLLAERRVHYGINNFIFVHPGSTKRNLLLKMSMQ